MLQTPTKTVQPLVSLAGVGVRRQGRWLVRGVEFSIAPGEIVTLIGPNGSGKSTTAKTAIGVLKADEGRVERKAGLKVGYVPQKLSIDWTMPLTVDRLMTLTSPLKGAEIDAALEATGIRHLARAEVQHLSGGEFQRALLARAIARKPDLLVLDEPFESVDPVSAANIEDVLRSYTSSGGTIIISSHSMDLVQRMCDHVAVIAAGRVLAAGTVDEVRAGESLQDRFLSLVGGRHTSEGPQWLRQS